MFFYRRFSWGWGMARRKKNGCFGNFLLLFLRYHSDCFISRDKHAQIDSWGIDLFLMLLGGKCSWCPNVKVDNCDLVVITCRIILKIWEIILIRSHILVSYLPDIWEYQLDKSRETVYYTWKKYQDSIESTFSLWNIPVFMKVRVLNIAEIVA